MQREKHYKDPKIDAAATELGGYRVRRRAIELMKQRLEECCEKCFYETGTNFNQTKVKGGRYTNKTADLAIMWADLETQIEKEMEQAERDLLRISLKLNKLSDVQANVLNFYYLKGQSLLRIATTMDYSYDGIRDLKHSALKKYAQI